MNETRPWSQMVRWKAAEPGPLKLHIHADEAQRARLGESLDVESILDLDAEMRIVPWLDGLEMSGILRARTVRQCGLSLEMFEEHVREPFVLRFVPQGSPNAPAPPEGDVDLELDLEADDPPESVAGEGVTPGDYLVELLALALDPFPRKPGAAFVPPESSDPLSPFAALARLKKAGEGAED